MTERDDAIYGASAGGGKFDPLWDDFVKVCKQRDLLLGALGAVEWVWDFGESLKWCPWCRGQYYDEGHRDNCPRQAAIAAAKKEKDETQSS